MDIELSKNHHKQKKDVLEQEYYVVQKKMKNELERWQADSLPLVKQAAQDYYANKLLFLETQLELHRELESVYDKKLSILRKKLKTKSPLQKTSPEELPSSSNQPSRNAPKSDSKITQEILPNNHSNSTPSKKNPENQSSVFSSEAPPISGILFFDEEDSESDVFSLKGLKGLFNPRKQSETPSSTANIPPLESGEKETRKDPTYSLGEQELEALLNEINAVKPARSIKSLEESIQSFRPVVNSLFVIYDKLASENRKGSWEERREELNAVIEQYLVSSNGNSIGGGPSGVPRAFSGIVQIGSFWVVFPLATASERFDKFLKDKRFREGVFATRWVELTKKRLGSYKQKIDIHMKQFQNISSNSSPLPRSSKEVNSLVPEKESEFFEKLFNETLSIILAEYSLPFYHPSSQGKRSENIAELSMPLRDSTALESFESKQAEVSYCILKLEIERFYLSKVSGFVIGVIENEETMELDRLLRINSEKIRKLLQKEEFAKHLGINEAVNSEDPIVKEAIYIFEGIDTFLAPLDIVGCTVLFVRKLCEYLVSKGFEKREISADVLFPYLVNFIVFSDVKSIHLKFKYLNFIAEKKAAKGEMGMCCSMVNAAAFYVSNFVE